jgi:NAD(P)-dependent dehydrogenase (short-subunit alcohol dehydrogenase family)
VLNGKVAIVTGAGQGIGRGEALTLAAEGATVVVNDIDPALAAATAQEIEQQGGLVSTNHDDVADWDGAEGLVKQAVAEHGRLDVLVNNAGFLRDGMSFKLAEDAWDDVIRVHLRGHFAPSRAAAAHWRDQAKAGGGEPAGGRIVNTVSEAGLYGGTGQANYVAAKAGIAGLTVGLARELQRYGVTVNAIAPRARTQMTEALLGDFAAPPDDPDAFDEWDPANIGPAVAWLASDAAADVTGQVFVVCGGRIHLMEGWTMVGEIEQPDRWSPADIEGRRAELFGGRSPGLPEMGFGR